MKGIKVKAFLNWSGGKDSALSLYEARKNGVEPAALVTIITRTGRVSSHNIKKSLIERQALSIGLPVHFVSLSDEDGAVDYEDQVRAMNQRLKEEGFTHVISGDIFLEDLRRYRETLYGKDGLECLFPLWGRDTGALYQNFMDLGFKAVTVAADAEKLGFGYCGREMDEDFLASLSPGIDPCGENGEFHSYVYDGPYFTKPVNFRKGGIIYREYPSPVAASGDEEEAPAAFHYCEIYPKED